MWSSHSSLWHWSWLPGREPTAPRVSAVPVLPYGVLARTAPIAVTGCAVSGLVGGAFYSLVPAWMQDQGTARETIALFMLVAVLGGLAFQIPVGRLSDRFDRRIVLAVLSGGFAASAFVMVLPAAVLGRPFSRSQSCSADSCQHSIPFASRTPTIGCRPIGFSAVSGRLILVSGVGSVLGPMIGASVMERFKIDGVFYLHGGSGTAAGPGGLLWNSHAAIPGAFRCTFRDPNSSGRTACA